jgi:hypothetical protein
MLQRDLGLELEKRGTVEAPEVAVKWRSYVGAGGKNTSDTHCHEGHPAVFTKHPKATLEVCKHHYATCKTQEAGHLELERNSMPWQLLVDAGFAENFTIIMGREIQSQHWITKMVTLFIGITQHLDLGSWNDSTGVVEQGEEVTVQEEDGSMSWAQCTEKYTPTSSNSSGNSSSSCVLVVDSKQNPRGAARSKARRRSTTSTAHAAVPNGKGHGSEFAQQALPKMGGWRKEQGLPPKERLIRPGGATPHPKSRFTLRCLAAHLGGRTWTAQLGVLARLGMAKARGMGSQGW